MSVIIPSAGLHRELSQRAIKSVLIDDEKFIIVFNGKDGVDLYTEQSLQNALVKYFKLVEGNASKVRNYGLSNAKGE